MYTRVLENSSAGADMNRETDVEMNNTGAAKMANNSGSADGTAPTPVELQGYEAVDSVMRGILRIPKDTHSILDHFSLKLFNPHQPLTLSNDQLTLNFCFCFIFLCVCLCADESMSKLKNKKTANNASACVIGMNSTKKRPDELVLDIDCRKTAKDDDTIR